MGRFVLSRADDWGLVHEDQNIRGWPVVDAAGNEVGTVEELIANTDSELVESVVLDNGQEYPARDIEIADGVVYVEGATTTGTDAGPVVKKYHNTRVRRLEEGDGAPASYEGYRDSFREHYGTTYGTTDRSYDYYEPAYRWGYTYGTSGDYRGRNYAELEPEMRRRYEEEHGRGTWERVKDAVEHAFHRARR